MPVPLDARIGTELLGYRLEAVVGRGGMGVVYRAHDPRLKRNVALKLLAPELTGDERFRERFLSESELAASLEHPSVVPVYDAGQVRGQLYIAMRYVEGTDLRALLASEGPLRPARALAVCSQVADALDAAHSRGLVHRDVKPSNVLLDERGHAYLADFGLTKRVSEQTSSLEVELSLGTPAYAAPEQIEGGEVDGAADQYSLGCLLCECLTGQPPFPRASSAAVLFAHLEETPPAPPGLEQVVARGLAKSPADRYPTCRELVDAARDALGIVQPRRTRWPFVVAGVGAAVLAGTLLAFMLERSSPRPALTVGGNTVAVINPSSDRVDDQVPVGIRPGGIAYGSGSIWVANLDNQTVSRIDPATHRVMAFVPVVDTPTGLAASGGGVWVVGSNPTRSSVTVRRIDPQFDVVAWQTQLANVAPGGEGSVATRGNAIWVAPSFGLLSRLDPRTGRVVQRIDPNSGPTAIAAGPGTVWFTDTDANAVTRVGPNGRLTPIPVGHGPDGIAIGEGAVWVADSLDDTVNRIDPVTGRVTSTIAVGRAPAGIAVGAGSVWVANSRDGTVTRIDPESATVQKTITVGGSPQGIVVAGGRAWVTVQPEAVGRAETTAAGGTATIVAESDFDQTLDPALALNSAELEYATCAKLVNYPDKPHPAGSQLIPEVAQSLPTRSADGKTYTFTIRSGFRFSPPSNEPVTAQTFKDTLERMLSPKMRSYWRGYFGDIVGARAYMAGKAAHISGIVVRRNRLVIRLLVPAGDLLARLATSAACAVPPDTPRDPAGVRLIPSAGPYYVASYIPGQGAVLTRNPNYTASRPRRLQRIAVTFGASIQRAVAEIESGAADYALGLGGLPPAEDSRLAARYGTASRAAKTGEQRYFTYPRPSVHFLLLNTQRPLFRGDRLRHAVNYAIDRRALARVGAPFQSSVQPADQYLPPGMPGFQNVHVYPFTPNLTAARRLTGEVRRTAVLYTCNTSTCEQLARIVEQNLKAIGIEVEVKAFPFRSLIERYARKDEPYDLALASWFPDYADPAAMLNVAVEGGLGLPPTALEPRYRRALADAARLSGPKRYFAYAQLDEDLVRHAAPWAVYANSLSQNFFSARMGCQVYQPVYGIDLAALCSKKP